MCVTAILGVGMLLSAAGTGMTMSAQQKQAEAAGQAGAYNGAVAAVNAKNIEEAAADQADKIYAESARIRGAQMATQAASGITIGVGSAGQVVAETESLASRDALVALHQGAQGSLSELSQGRLAMKQAAAQSSALKTAQYATLLQGASQIVGSYSSYKALQAPKT